VFLSVNWWLTLGVDFDILKLDKEKSTLKFKPSKSYKKKGLTLALQLLEVGGRVVKTRIKNY